ncbi:MAG: aconitate hydratase [Prevotellaceae bacterium]|jgi:aconitate hydratase|nr:aconitate hydratase [Prevotellaceae bacterium]
MVYDIEMIQNFYSNLNGRIELIRNKINRPLNLSEKVLYSHLYNFECLRKYAGGKDYATFRPDRVAMQDATAQMAMLQFMNAGKTKSAVPATIHCDHLVRADRGAESDLDTAMNENCEVYDFLKAVAKKYGIGFWKPGSGIIHQIILENYAFPGGMIVGTDSHTPNAGGLGMIAVGIGGADAVDVMCGMEWELKMPEFIGVKLTGRLNGWVSAKDIILKIAGILTVRGATNSIIEYFGDGASTLSATGKATVCNMGAEVGATASIFPFDSNMAEYLRCTGREDVALIAEKYRTCLQADREVIESPEKYFNKIIEINLSSLEPHINGPFTPDVATPISEFADRVKKNGYPQKMEVGLIGSCTNSSYQDLCRAASIARQAVENKITVKSKLIINPGSKQIYQMAKNAGLISDFEKAGATVMANACGPCIGQWKRYRDEDSSEKKNMRNSVVSSFNRNFAKRLDENPNTHAFVASPEIVMALAVAGDLCFNPLVDKLQTGDGQEICLKAPTETDGYGNYAENSAIYPYSEIYQKNTDTEEIRICPESERLQYLEPFMPANEADMKQMRLLLKVEGKCTTDHISMAGSWLRFRGHLENISDNMLMGAVNAFNGKTNSVKNTLTGEYEPVSAVAKQYREQKISSVVIAEENYGEGSSREHAAMEPRFLNVKVIIAKSFARIHETNLKKQGMLALTFNDKNDYLKIRENDRISIVDISDFKPERNLTVLLHHDDESEEAFTVKHSYNKLQIRWFLAGSALNYCSTDCTE